MEISLCSTPILTFYLVIDLPWFTMVICVVKNCGNYEGKLGISPDLRFYTFPNDSERFELWRKAAGCGGLSATKRNFMCSVHFDISAIRLQDRLLGTGAKRRKLSEDAVPTLFLPTQSASVLSDRTNRLNQANHRKLIKEVLVNHDQENKRNKKTFSDAAIQTLYVHSSYSLPLIQVIPICLLQG